MSLWTDTDTDTDWVTAEGSKDDNISLCYNDWRMFLPGWDLEILFGFVVRVFWKNEQSDKSMCQRVALFAQINLLTVFSEVTTAPVFHFAGVCLVGRSVHNKT